MKVRYKIILPVAMLMTIALAVLSFIGFYNISKGIDNVMVASTRGTLEDLVLEEAMMSEATEKFKKSLNQNFIRIARSIAELVRQNPEMESPENLKKIALEIGIDEIHIADSEGILYTGNVPEFFGFDFKDSEQSKVFMELITNKDAALAQDPQMRGIDSILFQYIGVPLKHKAGFLQIGVRPEELQSLMENSNLQRIIERFNYNEGGYAYVLDSVTKVCTHHLNRELIGYDMTVLDFANKIFEMENGSFTYLWKEEEIFTTFRTVGTSVIVTAVPTEAFYKILNPIAVSLLFTSLVSLLIVVLVTVFLVKKLLSPLNNINENLVSLSRGEADLTKRLIVSYKDDIGDVAGNFNQFMDKMNTLIGGIQSAMNKTGMIKDDVVKNTGANADSLENISLRVSEMKSGLSSMHDKINDSSSAMDLIASNADAFDNLISTQAAMVEESTAAITEMIASLENVDMITKNKKESTVALNQTAEEGKSKIEETSRDFSLVVEKIRNIQEMADVINGIASQTNLLSMNAAIEAAHAGDAGKGFAVVAEEIRKLAETSASSSGSISELISEITSGVENTSLSMGNTVSVFESISAEVSSMVNAFLEIENSVSELTEGGRQIMESTNEINNVTNEVSRSSREIHEGISTLNRSFTDIRDNSESIATKVSVINGQTVEVTDSTRELRGLSMNLDEITGKLTEDFNQFVTE